MDSKTFARSQSKNQLYALFFSVILAFLASSGCTTTPPGPAGYGRGSIHGTPARELPVAPAY